MDLSSMLMGDEKPDWNHFPFQAIGSRQFPAHERETKVNP